MAKEKTNTQAQEQAQELMTVDRQLMASARENVTNCLTQFGFKSSALEHDGNTYNLTMKNVNGGADIVKPVLVTDRVAKAFDDIASCEDLDKMSNIIKAWNLKLIESTVTKIGYNTVGEFAELNYGIKSNWANQLLNTAKAFLTEDENGVTYKYRWTDNVPFSNLALILPKINAMTGDTFDDKMNAFYEEYIVPHDDESSNVLPLAKQGELKKALRELNEKAGKTTNRKNTKTAQPETTPLTAVSLLQAWVVENEPQLGNVDVKMWVEALGGMEAYLNEQAKAHETQPTQAQAQAEA